jgi:hypothetical protein
MGTGHVWSNVTPAAHSWTDKTPPAESTQVLVGGDVRQFVVWDPYVSTPVSTTWDADTTTWIS